MKYCETCNHLSDKIKVGVPDYVWECLHEIATNLTDCLTKFDLDRYGCIYHEEKQEEE